MVTGNPTSKGDQLEYGLLRTMTTDEGIRAVAEARLGSAVIETPALRAAFERLLDYWGEHHVAPTLRVLEDAVLHREFPEVDEPAGWYIGELRTRYAWNAMCRICEAAVTTGRPTPLTHLRRLADDARAVLEAAGAEAGLDDEYLTADQLEELPDAQWLVEHVLPADVYGLLRGRDKSFKSFVALDWSLCLSTGTPWLGHAVTKVKVLYVVGEGAHGHAARVRAWEQHHGVRADPEWFVTRRSAVNLFRGGPAFDHLLRRVEDDGYGLVVFDTLRRCSGGAEGNGSDMGVVVDNIDRVRRVMDGGTVLVPAHTDKSDRDTRGYSGVEDDADVVWAARREEGTNEVALTCEKMKDTPDGHRLELRLMPKGSSLVVEHGDPTVTGGLFAGDRESDQAVMTAMRETFSVSGATVPDLTLITGLSRSSVYRSRARLVETRRLRENKAGKMFLLSPENAGGEGTSG